MKSNQKGFGIAVGLLVVLVISVVAGAGFYVYNKQKTKKASTDSSNEQPIKNTSVIPLEEEGIPQTRTYHSDTLSASFEYPFIGWSLVDTSSNGVTIASNDYKKDDNGKTIKGSKLTVYTSPTSQYFPDSSKSEEDNLKQIAANQSTGSYKNPMFIEVAGNKAIEFTHPAGGDSHKVVGFFANDKQYTIVQYFAAGIDNPYPGLIDTVVNSFTLD